MNKKTIQKRKFHFFWLYIPIAIISSTILGVLVGLLGMSISPANRSLSLGLIYITFPIISGTALMFCLGSNRPWVVLSYKILAGAAIGVIAWMINNSRLL
tara:strand:+ start:108 stop:407 length:300 start_codon:yes stop_codon:yes gene_type:complete